MYHDVVRSSAFQLLKPTAKCLLVWLNDLYIPGSRECIAGSVKQVATWIGCNKDTAGKAFRQLESAGFIQLVEHHNWQQRRARVWRLTFRKFNGREPTDEWKDV